MPSIGTLLWLLVAPLLGAALGFLQEGTWRGAGVGAFIGLMAAAWQWAEDRQKSRKALPGKARAAREAPVPGGSRPTSRLLWRRSKPAKHARVAFFVAAVAAGFLILFVASGVASRGMVPALAILAAATFGFGVYCWLRARIEVGRALDILGNGKAAVAVVRSVKERELRRSDSIALSLGWVVAYSFVDAAGTTRHGDSGYLPRAEAERFRAGDRGAVMFDPAEPEQSVWSEMPPPSSSAA